jgi:cytochrome b subunit of formate dehydrogenase
LRVNLLLNASLFVAAVLVMWSGIAISDIAHKALGSVGIALPSKAAWVGVHGISQVALSLLVGMHIAINWRWIVGVAVRLNPLPLNHRRKKRIPAPHEAREGNR